MNPTTNPLTIFQNQEFGKIRVEIINQEPMFVLRDVCRALEIQNVSQCKDRLKKDGVCSTYVIDRLGRPQQITVITESNLYKCIFQSRTEAAERFQDWVCEEVIPSIRKTGSYAVRPKESKRRITSPATRDAYLVYYEEVKAISVDWLVAEGYGSYRAIGRWVRSGGTKRVRRATDRWTSLLQYDTLPRGVRSALEMKSAQQVLNFEQTERRER